MAASDSTSSTSETGSDMSPTATPKTEKKKRISR